MGELQSVLLYASHTWRTTKSSAHILHTFIPVRPGVPPSPQHTFCTPLYLSDLAYHQVLSTHSAHLYTCQTWRTTKSSAHILHTFIPVRPGVPPSPQHTFCTPLYLSDLAYHQVLSTHSAHLYTCQTWRTTKASAHVLYTSIPVRPGVPPSPQDTHCTPLYLSDLAYHQVLSTHTVHLYTRQTWRTTKSPGHTLHTSIPVRPGIPPSPQHTSYRPL